MGKEDSILGKGWNCSLVECKERRQVVVIRAGAFDAKSFMHSQLGATRGIYIILEMKTGCLQFSLISLVWEEIKIINSTAF